MNNKKNNNNLPEFLKMAISHEERLIRLRQRQIEGYEQRIQLMKAGIDYDTAMQKVPPVYGGLKFEKSLYDKLRKENGVKKNGGSGSAGGTAKLG